MELEEKRRKRRKDLIKRKIRIVKKNKNGNSGEIA